MPYDKEKKWGHDELATDLADNLRYNTVRMVWENMQIAQALREEIGEDVANYILDKRREDRRLQDTVKQVDVARGELQQLNIDKQKLSKQYKQEFLDNLEHNFNAGNNATLAIYDTLGLKPDASRWDVAHKLKQALSLVDEDKRIVACKQALGQAEKSICMAAKLIEVKNG